MFRMAWIGLVVAVAMSLPVFGETGGVGVNLVSNASFEEAGEKGLPKGWSGTPQVFSMDSAVARSGKASLKFVNSDPKRYVLCTRSVAVKPGWKVRIGAWIKTQEIQGNGSGATICLQWSDANGKWVGGAFPSGISGTKDWTRVQATTRVPTGAVSFTISCYVRKEMTGTAWFDDVEVVRVCDPPMQSVVLSPVYRGRLAADSAEPVRVRVRLNLIDFDCKAADVKLSAALRQGEKAVWESTFAFAADQQDICVPSKAIEKGSYELVLTLAKSDGAVVQTETHALVRLGADAKFVSTLDEHRRLLVHGKPFFPLGMYISSINEADLKLQADSRFNCLMAYGTPKREQMDLAQKYGMKVIYSIKDWYFGTKWCPKNIKSEADEEPAVRQRVREMREHPALLAWYLNDELPRHYMPRLEAHQRWVAEEDPQHPTWAVLYQVKDVGAYLKTFDAIGTDPYPIGRKPASLAAQWTIETFKQVEQARPMWQVPQAFNWANYAKNDPEKAKGRSPTEQEMRSMAWQCISEGATGLIFYCWNDIKKATDVPFEVQWGALKRVAEEIGRLSPALLSLEKVEGVGIVGEKPVWLHWMARRHEGKTYLIVVNDGDGEGMVGFTVPGKSVKEAGRTVEVKNGRIEEMLAKLAVRIFEVE